MVIRSAAWCSLMQGSAAGCCLVMNWANLGG